MGYPVQPVRDHPPRQAGGRLADENEKDGLERILGVVVR